MGPEWRWRSLCPTKLPRVKRNFDTKIKGSDEGAPRILDCAGSAKLIPKALPPSLLPNRYNLQTACAGPSVGRLGFILRFLQTVNSNQLIGLTGNPLAARLRKT